MYTWGTVSLWIAYCASVGSFVSLTLTISFIVWYYPAQDRYALGHGGKVTSQTSPRRVSALKGIDIVDVAIGSYHAAAVSSEGELFTWGFGGSLMQQGALGHGDTTDQPRPALVEGLEQQGVRVHAVSCGQAHTMALADDGVLWATGEGESGRLGTGVSSIASF